MYYELKITQLSVCPETEGATHLKTQLALNLYYSGQHFTLNPSVLCLCYMRIACGSC